MAEAFGWGALGASALLVGALVSYLLVPGRRVIAVVMALGTGLLIRVGFLRVDRRGTEHLHRRLGRPARPGRRRGVHCRRLDPRPARRLRALLAMVADTLLPEAYEVERVLSGPLVVAGFAISIALDGI
jgi:hypothetical protein